MADTKKTQTNTTHMLVAMGICVVGFLVLLGCVQAKDALMLDTWMQAAVNGMKNPLLTELMSLISDLIAPGAIILAVLLLMAFSEHKKLPKLLALDVIGAISINVVLKMIIQRPRPEYALIPLQDFSFPSGHAMVSFALFAVLFWVVRRRFKGTKKLVWSIVFVSLILLVGFSRIYLGVHYTSDVLAGFFASGAWCAFFIHCFKKQLA